MPHSAVSETTLPSESRAEFFDRHPALPIVLLLLFPLALQVPLWMLGLSTDPIWFYSSIVSGPHLVPGSPYVDPNAGFTSEALGHLVALDWVHGVIPWWNPYSGIGVPLAGELQPGAFFLPFNLLLLFKEGLLWQRIAMQVIAGLGSYALLRDLGLSRLAAFLGGALFAVNGVIAWTPGPTAAYCSSPFLPCLLWGIERARKPRQGAASILAIGLAIAWSILAGFPEPAYISGLLALAWGLYRLTSEPARWVFARRALGGFALGLLVTAPLLIAFVDYLLQSDSFEVHTKGGMSMPWVSLPAMVIPYVYGPMNVLVDTWGGFGGYTEALVLVMAMVGVMRNAAERGLKLLLLIWVLLCWARNFGMQPVTAIIDHLPLMSRALFFRYAGASWIMALTILAAYGLEEFRNITPRRRNSFAVIMMLLLVCVALAWPLRSYWGWSHSKALVMFAFLGASLFWVLIGLAGLGLAWRISRPETRRITLAGLIIFDAAVMFLAAQVSARRNNQVDLQAMQFLHDHQGLSRNYSLGPLAPNYSAYFEVAGINHNILPVPKLWAQYVDRYLLPGFDRDTGVTFFWPAWGDTSDAGQQTFRMNLANFRDVGVKYVLANPGQSPLPTAYLDAADEAAEANPPREGGSKVRMGPRVLAWFQSGADNPAKPAAERFVLRAVAHLLTRVAGAEKERSSVTTGANQLQGSGGSRSTVTFEDSMLEQSFHKVYGDSVIDIWEVPAPAPYYQVMQGGPCTLATEQREDVTAVCSSPAKLRRRELYMPGWSVRNNGAASEPVQQDSIFQATTLPAGLSRVHYRFTPPHMAIGWTACLMGVMGLFWQVHRIKRSEETRSRSRQSRDLG